ncbi:MAG: MBL fold metallo-hydrolase [Magnetococcales bacterium]|nr:MBL fold metallo-hydrolase [Magnetococcales bacterium]
MSDATPLVDETYEGGVTRIDSGLYRPGAAACYLLVRDGEAAFVETGVQRSVPRMLASLERQGLRPEDVRWVIITHVHLDHAGGAGALMKHCPNAKLVTHPKGARHMVDPMRLVEGTEAVYGKSQSLALHGVTIPVPSERVEEAPDGHTLRLGNSTLTTLETWGHARHHMAILDEDQQTLYTGDAFGISYRVYDRGENALIFPSTTPTQFEPEEMMRVIDRVDAMGLRWVHLTHFGRLPYRRALADQLGRGVERMVGFAETAPEEPKARRSHLTEAFEAMLMGDLLAMGISLEQAELRRMLGVDIRLNVQGLEAWLERRAAHAT